MTSKDNINILGIYNNTMTNKLISTRFSDKLIQEMHSIVKERGYSSTQEFIRHATRQEVIREKQHKALGELEKIRTLAKKNFVDTTKEELEAHIKTLYPPE